MTKEEVLLSLGVDVSTMEGALGTGTSYANKWVENVKQQEQGYTGWWNRELKKREDMEVEASVRAASRSIQARRLLREREAARGAVAQAEQSAANTIIGGGSMPEGWAERGAAMKAGKELERKAMEAAEKGAAHGMSHGAMREAMVVMREGLRGDSTRMFGSATRLLGMLGLGLAEMTGIGAIIAEVAGIGMAWWSARKAEKEEKKSEDRLSAGTGAIAGRLKSEIENLEKAGRISHEQAEKIAQRLVSPSAQGNRMAQEFIRQHGGFVSDHDLKEMRRLDAEHQKKFTEGARDGMNTSERVTAGLLQQHLLKDQMAKLDRTSLDFKRKQLELDEVQINLAKDLNKRDEERAEAAHKLAEEQGVYDQAKLRMAEIQQRDRERFMPTLDELAHHGRFTRDARSIQRLERRIKRDFERGDIHQADVDIAAHDKAYNSLAGRHVIAENSTLRELRDINAEMQIHLKNIAEGKKALLMRPEFNK
jgi:hypothetical protein